jgi:soluble lytic murein transglycosylase
VAAYARYRAREDATATRLYTAITAAPPTPAEAASAWFFLGALAERHSDTSAAITAYGRSVEADPRGAAASDARWWLGLLLEERGRNIEAGAQFRQLVDDFPNSPFADAASIRAAVALAAGGASVPAAAQLRTITGSRDQRLAAEAARWLQVLGFATAADAGPATYLPTAFAAIAARDPQLLAPLPRAANTEWGSAPRDAAAADRWMATTFGPRPPHAGLLDESDLARGIALVAAGEETVGRSLLYGVLTRFRLQPYDLLDLMRVAEAADLPDVALEACEALFDRLDPAQRLQVPLAIERYAYPVAFPAEVRAAAAAEGVPPLLLLALIRQESAFNPFAGSSAGAMGLTQIVRPTGEQIAAALHERWPADLFDAATSLRYGAHYFATQLKRFDGDVLAALAAYNGGPENADRWRGIQRIPGADGYVYAIEFSETRGYIERVIENYAAYRRLYAGAPLASVR